MLVLIADDDPVCLRMLEGILVRWEYRVVTAPNGNSAWDILQKKDGPRLAVLDWMMPGMDGLEVCRKVRSYPETKGIHLILLTARDQREDIIRGLEAGADDYLTKPCNPDELRVRLQVGRRIAQLQENLAHRVRDLELALARVKQLQGLLPICSYCKKIRDDQNYWQQVESYIARHSEAQFSHGICPECYEREVKPQLQTISESRAKPYHG